MWYLFGPVICAVTIALVQLLGYTVARVLGWPGETPFFGLLLFRGFIVTVALASVCALYFYISGQGIRDW